MIADIAIIQSQSRGLLYQLQKVSIVFKQASTGTCSLFRFSGIVLRCALISANILTN